MRTRLTLLLVPFLLLLAPGCKSEPEKPAKPETTIENLKVAHAVAFRRAVYYAEAADQAENERLGNLGTMFKAIARSEMVHANGHEALLQAQGETTDTSRSPHLPLGTVRQALKMGMSLESTEASGLYPTMVQAAVAEQWPEAGEQFSTFMKADERHGELLNNAQERRGVLSISSYCICQGCGYIQVDQQEDKECPVCKKNSWERV